MQRPLTAIEAIGIAIRSEEDAARFYADLAKRIRNDVVRAKYESLSQEEGAHRRMLVELYQKMSGEDHAPPRVPGNPQTAESCGNDASEGRDTVDAQLQQAILREERADQFYRHCASLTSDLNSQKMFQYLADVEQGHAAMLKKELAAYRRDEHWYADNPDIQLVGP